MLSEQTAQKSSRCDERVPATAAHGKSLNSVEKGDAGLKADIANALWKDDVLRALEYYEIDVRVRNGVVHLNGHIVGAGSQNRINNAVRAIPGVVEIKNNLILDDKLTIDAAAALGGLEHTYGCKFFTGANHGVIFISGTVTDKNVRLLAEKCAADTPNARGVINNIQVRGNKLEARTLSFLQPAVGEDIYFLDWVSGVVKQVIINPNNRRVIAMVVQGKITSQPDELNSTLDDKTPPPDRLVVIPMDTVRHLTKTSGFLYINSDQRSQYMDFDLAHFITPPQGWLPPYPYCPDDVLFPVEYRENNVQIEYKPNQYSFAALSKNTPLGAQLLANDSLGG